jgi:Nucleotidyl transferase of unknown function (DUF2204)
MQLPLDFKEFIALMISESVRFVMIGGYAYNLYRNPRATGDIDFLVELSELNESRLRTVLEQFGFGSALPPKSEPLLEPNKIIMLGRAPFRIDILNHIDGVRFDDVFSSKKTFSIDGLEIPVISPEMLLKNKLSTGRIKDQLDADELKAWLKETTS